MSPNHFRRALTLVALVVCLGGCVYGQTSLIVTADSGSGQSAPVNSAFGQALVARVFDVRGNPITAVSVTFSAPASGAGGTFAGSGATETVQTDSGGRATSLTFFANTTAGSYSVTATASGATPASFSLTNTAGPAAATTATSGSGQTATVSTAFSNLLSATVQDAYGNPVSGVSVTFRAPGSGASGTFNSGTTFVTQTAASGVATAISFVANTIAGSYTVAATAAGVTGSASFALANVAGASASIVATSGNGQSTPVNTAFSNPLAATVRDQYGNPVSGQNVVFTAPTSGASGAFAGGGTSIGAPTNASGVATAPTFTANATSGSYTISAVVVDLPFASFTLTNTAGSPSSITATSGGGQSATVNTAFSTVLSATVKDANGNLVSGATVTFSAPSSGASGTFAGAGTTATAQTNTSGVATSPVFTANATAGNYSVNASVSGVASPATFALTNNAGTASTITATSGSGQSATVNTAFATALSATVKDANGNLVSGATVTFSAPSSGASGTFAGAGTTAKGQTNSSGLATAPIFTANAAAGNYAVTASVTGVANPASFALANNAGTASTITATSGSGQSATVNTVFTSALLATVKDVNGNLVSGATVTFVAPASGASGTFAGGGTTATTQTNALGVATSPAFTANATAGNYSVSGSVSGVAISAVFSLTNTAGTASTLTATSGSGQSATVNTAFTTTLSVAVKDGNGNAVSGASVLFSAPAAGASGTFAGGGVTATVQTNTLGVATAPAFTANTKAGAYSVTGSVGGASASFALTNTPGPASAITVTSGSGQSTPVGFAFGNPLVVTVKDAYGNLVSGASVFFSAPGAGAGGTFAGGGTTASAQTNSSGVATSPTFIANAIAGTYGVMATIAGLTTATSFSFTNVPALTISTTSIPNSAVGIAYTYTLVAQNGTSPYTWSVISGALPAGLSLNPANGAITGTPTGPGTFSLTVKVTDSGTPAQQATASFQNISVVVGLAITTSAVPNGTVGLAYSFTLAGQNGTTPYTWSITSGALPAGLSLNASTGAITGMPTATGPFPFTVQLSDSSAPTHQTATQALSLFINPPVTGPVMPTFSFSGLPTNPAPGLTVSNAAIALSQASSAAFAGTLTMQLAPMEAGLPSGYLGDAGFEDSSGNKSGTESVSIPAGTTNVALPTLDAGTVAGALTLTLTVGGETVAASTITIEPSAPVIEANSVQIIDVTPSGFSVELVATSTTRDLQIADFTFTPTAGHQISGSSSIIVNVSSLLTPWFASSSGLNYGGAFSLTIPFTISGSASAIQSVSVTLTNSAGTSAAVSGTQ